MTRETVLRLRGRDFDGFRRAVDAHQSAWPGGSVEAEWLSLPELQHAVLGPPAPRVDMLIVPADWLPALAAQERVLPLTRFLEQSAPEGWPRAWTRSFHEGVVWDGEVWGLPFHDGPQVTFVRTDLGDEHGLVAPGTWSDFLACAERLDGSAGRGRATGTAEAGTALAGTVLSGAPDGHNNVYDFVLHLWRFGGDLLDGAGRPALDSAQVRMTLRFLRDLATRLCPDDARDLDSNGSGAAFAEGRVATMVNWAGYAALADRGPVAASYSCAPAPTHDDGTATTTVSAFWVVAVSATTTRSVHAWSYLRHAVSAAMDLETTRAGATGARLSTWRDQAVQALRPEYALFEHAHEHSRPLPRLARLPALVDVLSDLVDAVVWRGEDPAASMRAAQRRAEQALALEEVRR